MITSYHSIPLYVSVPTGVSRNAFTKDISRYLKLASIVMHWQTGAGLNLTYRFFESSKPPTSNSAIPTGNELTALDIDTAQFAGDGYSIEYPFQTDIHRNFPYLALYATNTGPITLVAHAVPILELSES